MVFVESLSKRISFDDGHVVSEYSLDELKDHNQFAELRAKLGMIKEMAKNLI
jgi:hypothetical protein